jgi:alginate O-acetyltransferase complex protein AlgJ
MVKKLLVAALLWSSVWILGTQSQSHFHLDENRALAKVPELFFREALDQKYFSLWEKYFNDHFWFRGGLVRFDSWIDYHLFMVSPSPDVVLGKDNWLFYKEEIPDFKKEGCKERIQMIVLAQKLRVLEKLLEQSGKKLLFLVPPNKSTIYPEMVDLKFSRGRCNKSKYDLFLEAVKAYPVKGFLRLDTLLKEERINHDVFYKTDTHWNIYGVKIAVRAILRELTASPEAGNLPGIEISPCLRNGDLADMMALDLKVTEFCPKINQRSKIQVEERTPLADGQPRSRTHVTQAADPLLPPVIIFHDSSMKLPIEILEGAFSRVNTYWTYIPFLPEASEDIANSKIIIIEVQERYLDWEWVDVRNFEFMRRSGINKGEDDLFNTHVALGSSFAKQDKWKEAINEFQEAVRLRPNYIVGYKNIAGLFQAVGRFDDAIDAYHQVLILDPYDPLTHYHLGVIYQSQEKDKEALSELQRFIDLAPPVYFQPELEQAASMVSVLRHKTIH